VDCTLHDFSARMLRMMGCPHARSDLIMCHSATAFTEDTGHRDTNDTKVATSLDAHGRNAKGAYGAAGAP